MRTNRSEFAKFAVDLLLPLVEQRGVPLSLGHPSMESMELKVNGLVVMRSQAVARCSVDAPSREQRHLAPCVPASHVDITVAAITEIPQQHRCTVRVDGVYGVGSKTLQR